MSAHIPALNIIPIPTHDIGSGQSPKNKILQSMAKGSEVYSNGANRLASPSRYP
jgi:hypothetical protein